MSIRVNTKLTLNGPVLTLAGDLSREHHPLGGESWLTHLDAPPPLPPPPPPPHPPCVRKYSPPEVSAGCHILRMASFAGNGSPAQRHLEEPCSYLEEGMLPAAPPARTPAPLRQPQCDSPARPPPAPPAPPAPACHPGAPCLWPCVVGLLSGCLLAPAGGSNLLV
ncbi:unnamed protein product [Pleuronectes platessa]|uniref:Uncharacterized protein n=1 Tax=Pleuronectes platessa TaxID=8262 RepID=A0A9N7YFE1_PLEPL|nr:unnamed protein product [Pleuronectes platessa]